MTPELRKTRTIGTAAIRTSADPITAFWVLWAASRTWGPVRWCSHAVNAATIRKMTPGEYSGSKPAEMSVPRMSSQLRVQEFSVALMFSPTRERSSRTVSSP